MACPVCVVAIGSALVIGRYFGIPDVVVGILIGGLLASIGFWFDNWLRKRNGDRAYFPLQKVVIPLVFLAIGIVSMMFV